MRIKIIKIFLSLSVFLMMTEFASAAVIFETDFDDTPDWISSGPGAVDDSAAAIACSPSSCPAGSIPEGWNYSYITGRWWGPNVGKPSSQITNFQHYGLTGKAYTTYAEAPLSTSGGWGSDSIIMKMLPGDNHELQIRFKMKFDPNWQWEVGSSPMKKFMRFGYYHGIGDPWDANGTGLDKGKTKPQVLLDLAKYNGGQTDIASLISVRSNPYFSAYADPLYSQYFTPDCYDGPASSVCYFPPSGNYGGASQMPRTDFADTSWNPGVKLFNDSPGMVGDGGWHTWDIYFKNNTYPGATDGKIKVWLDGVLVQSLNQVIFNDVNATTMRGINLFSLGGNSFNVYATDNSTYPEQWVAYDDVVVYEPISLGDAFWSSSPQDGRLPYDYVVGSYASDTVAPVAPSGLSVQ